MVVGRKSGRKRRAREGRLGQTGVTVFAEFVVETGGYRFPPPFLRHAALCCLMPDASVL